MVPTFARWSKDAEEPTSVPNLSRQPNCRVKRLADCCLFSIGKNPTRGVEAPSGTVWCETNSLVELAVDDDAKTTHGHRIQHFGNVRNGSKADSSQPLNERRLSA